MMGEPRRTIYGTSISFGAGQQWCDFGVQVQASRFEFKFMLLLACSRDAGNGFRARCRQMLS